MLLWTGAAAAVILLAASGLTYYLYSSAQQTAGKMYEELGPVKPVYVSKDTEVRNAKTPEQPVQMKRLDPFTVLVLGVDQREHDSGRSDSMIVLSVNPVKGSILMFNIPRDTRTAIVGHADVDKINHAYAFGGVQMSVATVEHFLDYPIDYFVKINMESFARLIDLVGGVEVDNPVEFDYDGTVFAKGNLSLNGQDALKYARMRYDDPRGDIGRNARQRTILKQLMNKATDISNVTHLQSLLSELGNYVKTNITFSEMKTFVKDYGPAIRKVDSIEIKGAGQTIDRIWYYIVSEAERDRIHNLLKAHQLKSSA
ncbi:LCP family protein [Paenibacillus montanisoli]|uniref:LCP family glycopolymer transferase n=1 Tax=Paenibacillus montanisoli TaxID=2081970 RepID=UPI001F0BA269|nr:LCP family protein [Paenibacillus montanisoli]